MQTRVYTVHRIYGTFAYTCFHSAYLALIQIRVHTVHIYIWYVCIYVCSQYIFSTDANMCTYGTYIYMARLHIRVFAVHI